MARPVWHICWSWYHDPASLPAGQPGQVNDASRLNSTGMSETIAVKTDMAAAEDQLRELLKRAARENRKVAVAGARHSMGGHTIYPGGIAIDMLPFSQMELDETTDILHVGSGAKWEQILPYLNERGKSVAVMQSNNSFSVGGSISVNCHGWQTGKPPIASTVKSFRLMLADGTVVACSRSENTELFSLVLGGYGLFGIILDVDLWVVPNLPLQLERFETSIASYAKTQAAETAANSGAVLAYGRLDVSAANTMKGALLNVWSAAADATATTAPIKGAGMAELQRAIFRGSVGNDYGKDLRWWAERNLGPWISSETASRNDLLSVGVELFQNRSATDTDILHEYFIPPDEFDEFVETANSIISNNNADLLNVTVRDVEPDEDTYLRYAPEPRLCLVMLFNQQITAQGEAAMEKLTRQLIDAALDSGGSYYLPYRLHGTQEQIRHGYPMLDKFFEKKRQYDPQEIFQNEFYRKYALGL